MSYFVCQYLFDIFFIFSFPWILAWGITPCFPPWKLPRPPQRNFYFQLSPYVSILFSIFFYFFLHYFFQYYIWCILASFYTRYLHPSGISSLTSSSAAYYIFQYNFGPGKFKHQSSLYEKRNLYKKIPLTI